ncbi:MAG: S8 family serine peptidase [Roseobacter sp.]
MSALRKRLIEVGLSAGMLTIATLSAVGEPLPESYLSLQVDGENFDALNRLLGVENPQWFLEGAQARLFEPTLVTPEPQIVIDQMCVDIGLGQTTCTAVPRVVQPPPEIRQVPNGSSAFVDVEAWSNISSEQLSQLMAVASAELQSEFAFLVSPVSATQCSGTGYSDAWPFSASDVLSQLAITRSIVSRPYSKQRILVLDTGYFPNLIPTQWTPNGAVKSVSQAPSLTNNTRVVDGVNLAELSDNPLPPDGYELGWHGMSVADLALGGQGIHAFRSISNSFPSVVFAGSMKAFGTSRTPQISPVSLNNAYQYADENEISVINVSFLINSEIASFREVLRQRGDDILLVVAAGNDGRNLSEVNSWPAFLGGVRRSDFPGAVLSVGSHDPSGEISIFSRFNKDLVDILAPGCDVPTIELAGDAVENLRMEEIVASGTSYAAPLVSFTAAMLSGFGMRPFEIKDRINISAQTVHALSNKTFSSGILSVEDALAFPFTVVYTLEEGNRTRVLADPLGSPRFVRLCSNAFRTDQLAKISKRQDENGHAVFHIWEYGAAGAPIRPQICTQLPGDELSIDLQVWQQSEVVNVNLENLSDLIFHYRN